MFLKISRKFDGVEWKLSGNCLMEIWGGGLEMYVTRGKSQGDRWPSRAALAVSGRRRPCAYVPRRGQHTGAPGAARARGLRAPLVPSVRGGAVSPNARRGNHRGSAAAMAALPWPGARAPPTQRAAPGPTSLPGTSSRGAAEADVHLLYFA